MDQSSREKARRDVERLLEEALSRIALQPWGRTKDVEGRDLQLGGIFWRLAECLHILVSNEDIDGRIPGEIRAFSNGLLNLERTCEYMVAALKRANKEHGA